VPALLQSQAYVVDLTEAYDQLAALIPRRDEEEPPPVRIIEKPQRMLSLSPVTAELAADLLMDAAELEKIRDLLFGSAGRSSATGRRARARPTWPPVSPGT
jgi:hypothetical protein